MAQLYHWNDSNRSSERVLVNTRLRNVLEQHVSWLLLLLAKWFKYREIWNEYTKITTEQNYLRHEI